MRKNKTEYDEKQLLDRGRAYRYAFLTAMFTDIALFLVNGVLEVPIAMDAVFFIAFWIPAAVFMVAAIWWNCYEAMGEAGGRVVVMFDGIIGALILLVTVRELVTGRERFIEDGKLGGAAGRIVAGVCCLVVFAVYWVRQARDRRDFKDE